MPRSVRKQSRRLVAELRARRAYAAGGPVVVEFLLGNASNRNLAVLVRGTPLEGLLSPCLTVRRGRATVPYEGVLVKRGTPEPSEYAHLLAGEHVRVSVDLADAYHLPAGAYDVRLAIDLADVIEITPGVPLGLQIAGRAGPPTPEHVRARASLRVTGRGRPARTKATRVAALSALAAPADAVPTTADGVREPQFNGGDQARHAIVRQAHAQAAALCEETLGRLDQGGDAAFAEWFGDVGGLARVTSTFRGVAEELRKRTIYYDLTGVGCYGNWWAWTVRNTPGSPNIHLCSRFWTSPAEGADSKRGTIVHELTHIVSGTEDHAHDREQARALAQTDPARATRCADNLQYYAEHA